MKNPVKRILVLAVLSALCLSCGRKADNEENSCAIWLWSTHMKEAPLREWADKGIGHVLLNEAAFWKYDTDEVYAFADSCKAYGIKPHVWFQCFSRDRKWTFPVDMETGSLKPDFFDGMAERAGGYVAGGFEGIHLDYIRFCGNAHKFDFPETGLTGVGVVNECCKRIYTAVKAVNPDAVVSAALMPEIDSESRYGQRPSEMSEWLDVMMPMIYRYDYYGENKTSEWVVELTRWFKENSNGTPVWVGIQTYSVNPDDKSVTPLDAAAISAEYDLIKSAGADGVVLFRHGLGELPDFSEGK